MANDTDRRPGRRRLNYTLLLVKSMLLSIVHRESCKYAY
jgi:hypothetical protein